MDFYRANLIKVFGDEWRARWSKMTAGLMRKYDINTVGNWSDIDFARPELVGMHCFQWIDQPYYGRFDGENYNIGVSTINNLPYPELTGAMEKTNKRIYDVGSGAAEPFSAEIIRIPSIIY